MDSREIDMDDEAREVMRHAFSGRYFCQSPIEKLLGGALEGFLCRAEYKQRFVVVAQHRIGKYIPDLSVFLVGGEREIKGSLVLVVECDGHDFHERTKEQAKHDRAKDRWFLSHGIPLMRFTGSEIHNDPYGCAGEVMLLALKKSNSAETE